MPRLLKKDAIRLAEASIESLALAQLGVSSFHRLNHKVNIVRYAPETGLIGSSIELIMSSVLVQAFDKRAVLKDDTRYKTATEILHDFRKLLRNRPANITFLTQGVRDKEEHLNKILNLTSRFQVVITSRASAFHNGVGLNFDVLSVLFQEVSEFISLIAYSNNYKPYIQDVPKLIVLKKEKQLLIDEIFEKVKEDNDIESQKTNIASLFILLPEVPRNLPEWLEDFSSFNIAPKRNDIVNLINALEQANPVQLNRARRGLDALPVRIDNNNPSAIPIQPQFLRGQFQQFRDQFFGDAATANGRLENNYLDLPPTISVCRCFAVGLKDLSVVNDDTPLLTAHDAWPTIASALKVPGNGITFPIWNIVRKTSDLGQLSALLRRAAEMGNDPFRRNIDMALRGIDAIRNDQTLPADQRFYESSLSFYSSAKRKFEGFTLQSATRNYNLQDSYADKIEQFESGEISLSELGYIIYNDEDLDIQCKKYWVNKIAEATTELDSMPFLFEVYENRDFSNCKTHIKKTFRAIDLVTFGPRFEIEE